MTPAAQRLAIAGALGLEVLGSGELTATGILTVRKKGVTDWRVQQDWLSDLNAMNEAEETLQSQGIYPERYAAELMKIVPRRKTTVSGERTSHMSHYFDLIHATAAQRAEAFLKTKGLWQ